MATTQSRMSSREKCKKILQEAKNRPCADCGVQKQASEMTFDHLPGSSKVADVNYFVRLRSIRGLTLEISKCEVVCIPCHDIREVKRGRQSPSKHLVACQPIYPPTDGDHPANCPWHHDWHACNCPVFNAPPYCKVCGKDIRIGPSTVLDEQGIRKELPEVARYGICSGPKGEGSQTT